MKTTSKILALLLTLALPATALAQSEDPFAETEGDTAEPIDPTATEDPLATESTEPAVTEQTEEAGAGGTSGTFGVGVTGLLVGAVGGEAIYRLSDALAINAVVGALISSPDMGDTSVGFVLSAGALYNLFRKGPASLALGGRLDLGILSASETAVGFAIEVPLRAELALSDRVSIHGETGLVLDFVPDEGSPFSPTGGAVNAGTTRIAVGGQLLTSFGLTIYF